MLKFGDVCANKVSSLAHTDNVVSGSIDAGTIPAHGSVILKVSSAASQLTDQIALVGNADGGSFAAQLQADRSAVTAGETKAACGILTAYINHVRAQSGQQLSTSLASQLLTNAQQIQTLLGC